MADDNNRETGGRTPQTRTGRPDPRDAFSQEAAKNKKPPLGMGLSEKSDQERSEIDKSDLRGTADDAKGQSEANHQGGSNSGVSSANPRVLSGDEGGDATFPIKRPQGS